VKLRYLASVIRAALWLSVLASSNAVATFAFQADPTVGRVISIEPARPPGKLRVKQGRTEQAADATLGMTVRRGQVLTLAADARAAIYCPDGKTYDLKPGQSQGSPCTAPSRGLVYNRGVIPGSRGHNTSRGDFPAVLSPRKGFLLTTRPTIRWSPVTSLRPGEVIAYSVTVTTEAGEQVWRREAVTGTELDYPADAPRLARGESYEIIVQFGRKSSAQEAAADVGFTVVTDTDAKALRDAESAARLLKLPEPQKRLVVADLYASQELFSEAIEMLTALTKTLKEPAVLRLLGDIYAASGLHPEAVTQYEEALTLPQIGTDLEGQALTLAALGRSYDELGNTEQANSRFASAVEIYRKLGEKVTVEQLRVGLPASVVPSPTEESLRRVHTSSHTAGG
jgi:Flp pilus assembly protein TadD